MFSRGGSRDALVHSLPMEPSVKEFQDSVRRETPNRFLMIENTDRAVLRSLGSGFQSRPAPEISGFKCFPAVDLVTPWSIRSQWNRPSRNFKILTEGSRRTASACSCLEMSFCVSLSSEILLVSKHFPRPGIPRSEFAAS